MKIYEIIFSPAGGTKKVADTISKELGEEIIKIDLTNNRDDFSKYTINEEDLAIIALPSYGGRAPQTAIERLSELRGNNAKSIVTVVYGNRDYEDTLVEIYDTAKESGFNPVAGIAAIAEHSILPQYASGRPDNQDVEELKDFALKISNKDTDTVPKIPGNRPYKKISSLPLVPKTTKNCIDCKICVMKCPVGAINADSLKTDTSKCISCMRCIKICPKEARKVNKLLTSAASMALKKEASKRKDNELFL